MCYCFRSDLSGLLHVAIGFEGVEGGTRKVLVFSVFLCICCGAFSALLFMNVFSVIVVSFGVATGVATCLSFLCMVALVATFSRCCLATPNQPSKNKGTQYKHSCFTVGEQKQGFT
jgi:hypothetical protein